MLRRFLSAAAVLFVIGGFVLADTVTGLLTKVGDKEITVKVRSKEDRKGVEKTFKISSTTKFSVKTKDEEKETTAAKLKERLEGGKAGRFTLVEITTKGDTNEAEKVVVKTGARGKGKRPTDK